MGSAQAVAALGLVMGPLPGQVRGASPPGGTLTAVSAVSPPLLVLGTFDQPTWRPELEQAGAACQQRRLHSES